MDTLWSVDFEADSQRARWHAILGNIAFLWSPRIGAEEDRIQLDLSPLTYYSDIAEGSALISHYVSELWTPKGQHAAIESFRTKHEQLLLLSLCPRSRKA